MARISSPLHRRVRPLCDLPNGFAVLKRFAANANSSLEPSWQALLILVLRGTALSPRPLALGNPSPRSVVGYIVAHYLSFLVERGQQSFFARGDPFGRGWNLFGEAHVHSVMRCPNIPR